MSKSTENTTNALLEQLLAKIEQQDKKIEDLKAAKPAESVSKDELSNRVEKHNAVMQRYIAHQRDRLITAFGLEEDDDDTVKDGVTTHINFDRESVVQFCWGLCNTSMRQWTFARYMADINYMKMHRVMERSGVMYHREPDQMNGIDGQSSAVTQAERNYDFYISQLIPYEVMCGAAYSIWLQITNDKTEEAMAAGAEPRNYREPPTCSEQAYASFVDMKASKADIQAMNDSQEALINARLLRMTQLSLSE